MNKLTTYFITCLLITVAEPALYGADVDMRTHQRISQPSENDAPFEAVLKMQDGRTLEGIWDPLNKHLIMKIGRGEHKHKLDPATVEQWWKPTDAAIEQREAIQKQALIDANDPEKIAARLHSQIQVKENQHTAASANVTRANGLLAIAYETEAAVQRRLNDGYYRWRAEAYNLDTNTARNEAIIARAAIAEAEAQLQTVERELSLLRLKLAQINPNASISATQAGAIAAQKNGLALSPSATAANRLVEAQRGTVLIRTSLKSGTGFLANQRGWIVTNKHVVEGLKMTDTVDVLFNVKVSVDTYRYRVQWKSSSVDLAILSPDAGLVLPRVAPLEIDGRMPEQSAPLTTTVQVMGYPIPDKIAESTNSTSLNQLMVTTGTITTHRNRDGTSGVTFIGVDAKATHGNSGGPVIDSTTGRVIGVVTLGAKATTMNANDPGDSFTFAIPSYEVSSLLNTLERITSR